MVLWPCGLLLAAWRTRCGALKAATLDDYRGFYKVVFVFATVIAGSFLTSALRLCWDTCLKDWRPCGRAIGGTATAFAAAAAIGSIWHVQGTALRICPDRHRGSIGRSGERPNQIVAGAALGLLISLLVRQSFLRRGWGRHVRG